MQYVHLKAKRDDVVHRNSVLVMALCLVCAMLLCLCFSGQAEAKVRATDVTQATSGNELVLVPGTFSYEKKATLLKQVNKIRKEACGEGVPDPRNSSRKLSASDYRPIKWSSGLEQVAQTRAAEGSILQDHQRPNGNSCFDNNYPTQTWGECLAWNGSGDIAGGIDQWYEEKSDWVNQTGGVTGHYTSLIDPDNTYIGLGGFTPDSSTSWWGAVAGEFTSQSGLDESQIGVQGACDQVVEVPCENVTYKLGTAKIKLGSSVALALEGTVSMPGIMGGTVETGAKPYGTVAWTSGASDIVSVDGNGTARGIAAGTAQITGTYDGKSLSAKMTVIDPKTVKTVTVNSDDEVTKSTVRQAIADACGEAKRVTSIVLGKDTWCIKKGAFKGLPKVKTLVIKTKNLIDYNVTGSLKGSKITTIKVSVGSKKANKKYVKRYKTVFSKANAGKKVKVIAG